MHNTNAKLQKINATHGHLQHSHGKKNEEISRDGRFLQQIYKELNVYSSSEVGSISFVGFFWFGSSNP